MEKWFLAANLVSVLGWILLVASRWVRNLRPLICLLLIPVILSIAYLVLIAMFLHQGEGGFGSLEEVASLFNHRGILMAGWLHYLAFDLLVGTWIWCDGERHGIPWWLGLPCLFFAFMFGPIGFLLHLIIRGLKVGSPGVGYLYVEKSQ